MVGGPTGTGSGPSTRGWESSRDEQRQLIGGDAGVVRRQHRSTGRHQHAAALAVSVRSTRPIRTQRSQQPER